MENGREGRIRAGGQGPGVKGVLKHTRKFGHKSNGNRELI